MRVAPPAVPAVEFLFSEPKPVADAMDGSAMAAEAGPYVMYRSASRCVSSETRWLRTDEDGRHDPLTHSLTRSLTHSLTHSRLGDSDFGVNATRMQVLFDALKSKGWSQA